MTLQSLIILMTILLFTACKTEKKQSLEFVEKFGNDSFESFKNYSIFNRGYDKDGNPIIFVSKMITSDSMRYNSGHLIVIIENETGKVKETKYDILKKGIEFDTTFAIGLSQKFFNYRIFAMGVNEDNSVFIEFYERDRPHLIKTANIESYYSENEVVHLKGKWYMIN